MVRTLGAHDHELFVDDERRDTRDSELGGLLLVVANVAREVVARPE
jgi:hypothetical protein